MKERVLQALLIAGEEMRDEVRSGMKNISIRTGHRDYIKGRILIGCHLLDWAVMGQITQVRHTSLSNVTLDELRADGFDSHEQAIFVLSQWYPDIHMGSDVTIIRWKLEKEVK